MLEIIIAIIASGFLTTLLTHLLNRADKKKEKDDGLRAGMRLLLLDSIKTYGSKYVQANKISSAELSEFIEKYETYKILKGDGYADAIYKRVMTLPINEE